MHTVRLDASRQETGSGRLEAILEAVNFTAVQLLKAPRWQDALDEVLAKLGQATGVRRVYLHLVQLDGAGELIATNEAEWVASGVELIFDLPSYSPYRHGGGAEMRRTLDAGEVWIGGRDDLPLAISEAHPDNAPETALIAPVIVAGERRGALGFNHLDERRWSGAEVAALQTAAEIIGAAISRDRAENHSQSSGQLFRSMFESTAVGIVLVEFETLRPLQVNAAFCAMVGRRT